MTGYQTRVTPANEETELPDFPDDITYDTTFPQFQPKNLALGLESTYGDNEVGQDGLTKRERKYQQDSKEHDKMMDDLILSQIENIGFDEANDKDALEQGSMKEKRHIEPRRVKVPTTKAKYNSYNSNVSSVRARDAAAALSTQEYTGPRTRSASRPRVSSSTFATTRKPKAPLSSSSMRHNAAVANSKTTVGYSKGREVSSKLHGRPATKQSAPKTILSPDNYLQLYGPPPLGSEMWLRCKAAGCFDEEKTEPEVTEPIPTLDEDEEAQDFQLAL